MPVLVSAPESGKFGRSHATAPLELDEELLDDEELLEEEDELLDDELLDEELLDDEEPPFPWPPQAARLNTIAARRYFFCRLFIGHLIILMFMLSVLR